jgi:hypothetical protein
MTSLCTLLKDIYWTKFCLENDVLASLCNIIAHEMLVYTLIHHDFTSCIYAKVVIENDKMYTENAARTMKQDLITPENNEPAPKNPKVAAFFRIQALQKHPPRVSGSCTYTVYAAQISVRS